MTATLLVTGAGGVGKTTVAAAIAITRGTLRAEDPRGDRRPGATSRQRARGVRSGQRAPAPSRRAQSLGSDARRLAPRGVRWPCGTPTPKSPPVSPTTSSSRPRQSTFPASQAYAAADQAATFVQAKAWDLVVVDTPPSGGGIDFFTAPAQMADLVGGRLLRWMTGGPAPRQAAALQRRRPPDAPDRRLDPRLRSPGAGGRVPPRPSHHL